MDLDDAVKKHAEWKIKFRTAITQKDKMDDATISKDNCCMLGQWLYGDGRQQFGSHSEFTELVSKHKEFHTAAGNVARQINAADYANAEKALGSGTPYSNASSSVGLAIQKLKRISG